MTDTFVPLPGNQRILSNPLQYEAGSTLLVDRGSISGSTGQMATIASSQTGTTGGSSNSYIIGPISGDLAGSFAQSALNLWSSALGFTPGFTLSLVVADLPRGQLGYGLITSQTTTGTPESGLLVLDVNADGRGWFMNSMTTNAAAFSAGGAAAGHYDLLTVVAHEMGHLFGFTDDFGGFASRVVTTSNGQSLFLAGGVSYELTADRDHLDPAVFGNDLMNPTLGTGVRRLPSAFDAAILRSAWQSAGADTAGSGEFRINLLQSAGTLPAVGGFVMLAEAVATAVQSGAPNGLQDGGFAQSGTPGWIKQGDITFAGGTATLNEDPLLLFTESLAGLPCSRRRAEVEFHHQRPQPSGWRPTAGRCVCGHIPERGNVSRRLRAW